MYQQIAVPSLTNKIWVRIFHFLSASQLKTVRLVGAEWNRIVRSSPKLLGKFLLAVPTGCTVQQVAHSRYRAIRVRVEADDSAMMRPIKFMKNVTELVLEKMPSVSVWTAQSVERQCRQLETLRIIDCDHVVGFVPERTTMKVIFE